jgi:hypothetical protein
MVTRRSFFSFAALSLGMFLALSLSGRAFAEPKQDNEARLSGAIHMINKDASTITVRNGNMFRKVVYDNGTKFTFRNKSGSLNDVQEGVRVICLGKYDEKNRLLATRVDVREHK